MAKKVIVLGTLHRSISPAVTMSMLNVVWNFSIGAGVSGLTCAVSLLKSGYKDVTVVGQYIPGDKTIGYTSPWAGASILSFASATDMRLRGW